MSVRGWWLWGLVAGVGCGDPSTIGPVVDAGDASPLRPRFSGAGRLEVRSPEVPGQVVVVDVDGETFDLVTPDDDVQTFVEALPGLDGLFPCLADFDDLGELVALCAEVDTTIVLDVTAVPAESGDQVAWTEVDRFGQGCAATDAPDTLRCGLIDSPQRLSPLATFTPADAPPLRPEGACDPLARMAGFTTFLEPYGDQLILGGTNFIGLGQAFSGLVAFGEASLVDTCVPGPSPTDTILGVVQDASGNLIVSGDFEGFGGEPGCENIARVLPDGSVDPVFCQALTDVEARSVLLLDGTQLYIANRLGVTAYDLASDTVTATSPPMVTQGPREPIELALLDGTLFLVGTVLSVGDETYEGLAAFDATTLAPLPVPVAFEFGPHAIEVVGDDLWIGGDFRTVNGENRARLAVVDGPTRTLTGLSVNVDGLNARVDDLAPSPDGVWVAGLFETVAGQPRGGVALVSPEGQLLDDAFDLRRDTEGYYGYSPLIVSQVLEKDGVVTVLGDFELVGDVPQYNLASFRRSDGALIDTPSLNTTFDSPARMFETASDRWFWAPAGVEFAERDSSILIFDPVARTVDPFDLDFTDTFSRGTIFGVTVDGDVAYLTGFFAEVMGQPRDGFAAVDLVTKELLPPAPTFQFPLLSGLTDVEVGPDAIYIAGPFDQVDDVAQANFVALDKTTGNVLDSVAPTVEGSLAQIVRYEDTLVLCGSEMTVNGSFQGALAFVSAVDGSNLGFGTPLESPCFGVVRSGDTLYVSSITSPQVSGLPEPDRLFAVNAQTGALLDWQPGVTSGSIFGFEAIDSAVLIAGLDFVFDYTFPTLLAYDPVTADRLPFDPPFEGYAYGVRALGDQLVIATSEGELRFIAPPK